MSQIGVVTSEPKQGYCFLKDLETGESAFLHVKQTAEKSLAGYHRGSHVSYTSQLGEQGRPVARNARLLVGDELDNWQTTHEKTLLTGVEGIATSPLNSQHYLFAWYNASHRVRVLRQDFTDQQSADSVMAGTIVRFDVVETMEGQAARQVEVVRHQDLDGWG